MKGLYCHSGRTAKELVFAYTGCTDTSVVPLDDPVYSLALSDTTLINANADPHVHVGALINLPTTGKPLIYIFTILSKFACSQNSKLRTGRQVEV
jgi:hypothetical protein